MPHGGQRTPENPAAVSGPGALSQRTDGGPARAPGRISNQPYGEGQAANQLLRQARQPAGGPPTSAPNQPQQGMGSEAAPGQPLPDAFAPTERPGEPVTAQPASPAFADDPDELLRTLIGLAPDARSRARLIEMLNT